MGTEPAPARKPKVLVIDDSAVQRQAALDTIDQEKYDLVVVDNIEDAMYELGCIDDWDENERRSGFGRHESKILGGGFDYILTDLHMPASLKTLGEVEPFKDTLQPYGFPVMLLALSAGVKGVGILTEGNHHDTPMNAICDAGLVLGGMRRHEIRLDVVSAIGTTRVLIKEPYGPFLLRKDHVDGRYWSVKNWGALLVALETGVISKN